MDASTFEDKSLPSAYDAVMLDAPCSNTGVIQRRTDVKWRLQPNDIKKCAKLQLQLLHSAARFVKAGGRITYSTCSIEAAENQLVVDAFLASKSGRLFKLEKAMASLPWETGHDGAGAFLLRREA
jgi:16S rRNA (cytosine967-C5)-methyltransferase